MTHRAEGTTRRRYVRLAVIAAGAAVLAVEIAGARLFGPYYGAGLYLWSAMIGIALGALSLGYLLGGRLADRGATAGGLAAVIGAAGLWTAVSPWMLRPVLAAAGMLGLRAAVLFSAAVLFFPPLMLLGMITPYAVRLRASRLEEAGRSAGEIYALSTIAGVAAAIATGFVLIPAAGAARLVFLTGAVLLAAAGIGFALSPRGRILAFAAILIVAAAALRLDPNGSPDPGRGLLAVAESPYGEIRVVEKDGLRLMLIDGGVHTEVDAQTLRSRSPYVDVLELAGTFFNEPGRMLVVGLGGGAVVRQYARAGWEIDAVEIDPVVTRLAISHFGLEPETARIHHMDGREFLMRNDAEYDLIIVDAFGSSSIPFHLVTEEAFALFGARLAPRGVIAMNVIASGWDDVLVRSLAATMGRVFSQVRVLPMAEPPDQLGNLILLASSRELEPVEEPPVPEDRFSPEYHRAHAWDNRFEVDPAGVRVLTDDANPVDLWAERINLEVRRSLHEYFGSGGIGW
ncbi:MAG: fused MFS/spermidine synthase [Candidatus Krumholzibacteria bacterium]|nr:fused MFS/spermidine synthase [Candidatus Krumholzibacteria bacterium]